MLRLQTFGGLSVRGPLEGSGSMGLGKRPLALLALMAVAGSRGLRREKVIALLWPESDEERGRNSLSQALTALRRGLGADAISAGTSELRIEPETITSDVQEFECAIEANDLERAASLYEGPFLDGVHIKGAHGFDEWADEHRLRFRRMHATVLERLALAAEGRGDAAAAVAWWRRLATLEPTTARAALGLMRVLSAAGERATALQHYRVYEALLRQSIGAEPDPEVVELANALRDGKAAIRATLGVRSSSDVLALHPVVPGRADAWAASSAAVTAEVAARTPAMPWRRSFTTRGRMDAWWIVGCAAVAILGILIAADTRREATPAGQGVAILPFRNLTGDSTVDALGFLAAQHIADGLQRSALVDVTNPLNAADITAGLHGPADPDGSTMHGELTPNVGRASLVMGGTIGRERDSLVVVSRLTDVARGTLIAVSEPVRIAASAPAPDLERVRQRALGMLAARLDRTLDDLLPPGSSPPPTLAAYTEFLEGLQRFQRRDEAAALPFFERAYALDSSFVTPLVWQAWSIEPDDEGRARKKAIIKELARHRDQLAPIDRQALEYLEANQRNDASGRIAALQRASQLAPGSVWTYNLGNALNGFGRSEEAVAAFDRIDRRRGWLRYWPAFWGQYARALHYVDHERELQLVREARAVLTARDPSAHGWLFRAMLDEGRALVMLGRYDELDRVIVELEAVPDPTRFVGNALSQLAMELWDRGDSSRSRRLLERSLAWYQALPATDRNRRVVRAQYAEALYHADRWSDARPIFERLVAEQPEVRLLAFAGLAAAREGDRSRAEAIVAQLESWPDTVQEWNMVVDSRLIYLARLAAVLGNRDRAVDYIKRLNGRTGGQLSRHVQHKDFAGLENFPPFLRVTRPFR